MLHLLKKTTTQLTKNWYFFILLVPLTILISSIWDNRYYIGGDVMIPLSPIDALHKLNLWYSGKESLHFLHLLWYLYYALCSLMGLSSLVAQKLLIIITYLTGFVFTYLLHKELFSNKAFGGKLWAYLSAVFFTFNPIYFLLVTNYLPLYGFPVCLYFLLKAIKSNKLIYSLIFSFTLNLFFFIDLPQPKLLIVFFITSLFTLFLYRLINRLSLEVIIRKTLILGLITFATNLWIVIPFAYSTLFGQVNSIATQIPSHNGVADIDSTTLTFISRFFNLSIVNYYPKLGSLLTSIPFAIWSFFLWLLIAIGLMFSKKDKTLFVIYNALFLFVIFLLFISKGPNPPLGNLYTLLINKFPLARVFRTTASVTAGVVVFYSFLISLSLYQLNKRLKRPKVIAAIILLHIVIFSPLYLGHKYLNNIYSDSAKKGFAIPGEYYSMANTLDALGPQARILSIPSSDGYIEKKWGYQGADLLTWMSKAEIVGSAQVAGLNDLQDDEFKNSTLIPFVPGYATHILGQKDGPSNTNFNPEKLKTLLGQELVSNEYFSLYEINPKFRLDKFFSNSPGVSPQFSYSQKKPTSYEVTITNIDQNFNLIFTEPFDHSWGIYPPSTSPLNMVRQWLGLSMFSTIPSDSSPLYNQWDISFSKLCTLSPSACHVNSKGENVVNLTIIYWPQRLFYLSIILSIISTITLLAFISKTKLFSNSQ